MYFSNFYADCAVNALAQIEPQWLPDTRSQARLRLWEPHPHKLRRDHVVPSPTPARFAGLGV